MNWIVLSILIILSLVTIWLIHLAANKRDWGNILGAVVLLLVTVSGWVVTESRGYLLTPGGTPELEITNQIDEIRGQDTYLAYVVVRNQGTGTARNCVIKIEYHANKD